MHFLKKKRRGEKKTSKLELVLKTLAMVENYIYFI